MDRAEFANPGTEYRGVTLWMLNDELKKEEITRQLHGFHEAGWGAVIARTFNGLLTQYLGEEWMDITAAVIEEAAERDMKVWLQAGYMPSGMPGLGDDEKFHVLVRKPKDEALDQEEEVLCADEEFNYCRRVHGTVLDLLNSEAVDAYLEKAYQETWGERFGDEFGKTVETVWVDEPHFRPPHLPWSRRLPELFEEHWGYSIIDDIPLLFGEGGDCRKVRHHYWRVVLAMFIDGYFEHVGKWCAEHDIRFSGHLMGEDSLYGQIGWTGSAMPGYVHMQLPGIDHLTGNMTWPTGRKFITTPKQCSSASSQLGRREVLAEMYGVSSQGLSFERRKWIADWLISLGINYRCYHGSFYSMRGRRKRIYPPNLNFQQPWWEDNRPIADYYARLCYAMRQGQYAADVMLLHPVESGWCVYDSTSMRNPHDRRVEPPEIRQLFEEFVDVSENLLKIQRGFEYGDEYLMARHGEVADGKLKVGEAAYKVVILPRTITMRRTTVELLERFIEAGGTVLRAGQAPTRMDGVETTEIESLTEKLISVPNSAEALRAALDDLVPASAELREISGNAENVWVHERDLNGRRMFFVTNTSLEEAVEAELWIRGAGRLERWNLETGEVEQPAQRTDEGFTVAPMELPPVGSCMFVLDETAAATEVPATAWTVTEAVPLEAGYDVTKLAPNALTLDFCRYAKGDDDWSEPVPVILVQERLHGESYEGPLRLQFEFHAEPTPENVQVAIEDAAEYAITINGQPAAYDGAEYYVDPSFHPVDISDHVQVGRNVLELSREFRPVPRASFRLASLFEAARGVELESIYLIGDFAVKGRASGAAEKEGCVRLQPDVVLTQESGVSRGNLVMDGYPFFAGRIQLAQKVSLRAPRDGERVALSLPNLDAALVKVWVNDQSAGSIMWAPYEVDVTDLVRQGKNEVRVEFVTTLRNLLGPHHRLSDEFNTWGHSYSARWPYGENWYEDRDKDDVDWTNDYFVFPVGLDGDARIEFRDQG